MDECLIVEDSEDYSVSSQSLEKTITSNLENEKSDNNKTQGKLPYYTLKIDS